MCLGGGTKVPDPAGTPPPPTPTADRVNPITNPSQYRKNGRSALRIDLSPLSGSSGLNIPT